MIYKNRSIHQAAVAVTTTTTAEELGGAGQAAGQTFGTVSATHLAKIVQVGVPATAASIQVQVSGDGTNFFDVPGGYRETDKAAGTYTWVIPLPQDAIFYRVVFTQQAGGASSTYNADTVRTLVK